MKKIHAALCFPIAIGILFLVTNTARAQLTAHVPSGNPAGSGAGNTTHRKPFGSYYGFERCAMKYLSREMSGISGTISSLSFYCDTTNTSIAASTPVKIFLKEVSDSTFNASSVNTEETNSTLVF